MAERYTYVIEGDPTPLFRAKPAYNQRLMYDSQKNQKLVTGITLSNQHNDRPFFTGPIALEAVFYMPVPKTRLRERTELLGTFHFVRPDLSNLLKYIEDAALTILYKDDCIISKIAIEKIYGEPRTEFTISSLR
jgi:Holliday junction resolvase RusA-like endonuclease